MVDTVFDYITVVVVAHHNCDRRSVGANFKVGCTRAWLFQHFATRYMFIHIAVLSLFLHDHNNRLHPRPHSNKHSNSNHDGMEKKSNVQVHQCGLNELKASHFASFLLFSSLQREEASEKNFFCHGIAMSPSSLFHLASAYVTIEAARAQKMSKNNSAIVAVGNRGCQQAHTKGILNLESQSPARTTRI